MARDINIKIGATDTASAVFAKVAKNLNKMNTGLDKVGTSFQSMGSFSGAAGRRLAAAGGAITGAFAIATRTFARFDDSMAAVSAKSGATGESLMGLRDLAKELGSTTKFSASEAASGMEFLAQAGFKTEQIMSAIGPALSLATAGGVELNEAADIASNVAAGFGLSADEFGRVADVMARAATSANTDILMMGETFNQSASIAKTAGQSIEETAAALGLLANSGVQASSAGTDIKNVLSRLAEGDVQKQMEALGVTVKDTSGEFRPMLDIMRDFGKQTQNMAGPDKLALSMELFGKISGKSALILSDAGNEVDSMRLKMVDATVTADTMAATMQSGLGGLGTTIMSSLEGAAIAIGESIKEPLMVAGKAFVGFTRASTDWIQNNPSLVAGLGAAAFAITGVGIAAIGASGALMFAGATIAGLQTIVGIASAGITAALSPIIAPIVGIAVAGVGLGVVFGVMAYKSGLLSDALEETTGILRSLMSVAKQTFEGITNAISAGNWGLAASVGMAGVKVAVATGLEGIYHAFVKLSPKLAATVKKFFVWWVGAAFEAAKTVVKIITNPAAAAAEAFKFLAGDSLTFDIKVPEFGKMLREQRIAAQKELNALTKEASEAALLKQSENPEGKSIGENWLKGVTDKVGELPALIGSTLGGGGGIEKDVAAMASKLGAGFNETFTDQMKGIGGNFPSFKLGDRDQPISQLGRSKSIEIQATQGRLLTGGVANSESELRASEANQRKQQLAKNNSLLERSNAALDIIAKHITKPDPNKPFELKVIT
ncbi:phage tail tape measure protein [Rhodopirellula bahusiensis]|uniref:Phage tail tape measure protein n=1 Tax=Rhodopirellula bahusiensis TaxID=2014065 RepID=A0A2G1WAG6_9BACT|nr:phage tail tape measure protein [Rhodopirellula bahusiensis]PHQ35810.1 phage tail tape measure protein [Rhodopirellula bahusiensis]